MGDDHIILLNHQRQLRDEILGFPQIVQQEMLISAFSIQIPEGLTSDVLNSPEILLPLYSDHPLVKD